MSASAASRRSRLNLLRGPVGILVLALVAATIAYLPTLNSAFYSDDYIYFDASRQLSFSHYARMAFTPWSVDPNLPFFTRDYWRPLAFLYFEAARPLFGAHVLPYHLVNLSIHLASIVIVWLLARKLDPRPLVAGVAVLVFAFYPGSTDAISWISSINSAGLPLALGSWLVFLSATSSATPGRGYLLAAAALLALALMFRETSATLLAAIGLWYLLVQRRDRLRNTSTYTVFIPYAAVLVGYYLIRTKLLSEPAANPAIYGFGDHFGDHWWYYIKNALLPFREPVAGWRLQAQAASGVVLLAFVPLALVARRWALFALSAALVLSTIPSAAAVLGAGQRYFYFSTPVLAIGLGLALAEIRDLLERRSVPRTLPAAALGLAALAVAAAGTFFVFDRNDNWNESGPAREQSWVDELRAEYPGLPAGGTLYCENIPFALALFDAVTLLPTVRWYYPEVGTVHWVRQGEVIPTLGPADRLFIAGDGLLLGDTQTRR